MKCFLFLILRFKLSDRPSESLSDDDDDGDDEPELDDDPETDDDPEPDLEPDAGLEPTTKSSSDSLGAE